MSSIEEIYLKAKTRISLHDRFANLKHTTEREAGSKARDTRSKNAHNRTSYKDIRDSLDRDVRPRAPRQLSSLPGARHSYGAKDWEPTTTTSIMASIKLKGRRSVHQRLGVRARIGNRDNYQFSRPSYRGYGFETSRARMRGDTDVDRDRSLENEKGGVSHRRRWNRGRARRNSLGHFVGWGGGNKKRRGGRGRFRKRGWGGGGRGHSWGGVGGRRGRKKEPAPSREDLDKELDDYMAGTKSALDKDLDDYASRR